MGGVRAYIRWRGPGIYLLGSGLIAGRLGHAGRLGRGWVTEAVNSTLPFAFSGQGGGGGVSMAGYRPRPQGIDNETPRGH